MGETTIEWTDYTFNPWIGCTRVSQGCVNCYAESFARRYGKAEWGPTAQRVRTSNNNWRKPLLWNAKAEKESRRYKVFCASLADVFEDNDQLREWRTDLWRLIDSTPHLDWLLLTKRPEHISDMAPVLWFDPGCWPANLWIGTSVESQEMADKRIPELLTIPARVRFLSCEPLLGPVDLTPWLSPRTFGELIDLDNKGGKHLEEALESKEIYNLITHSGDIYGDGVIREYQSLEPETVQWVIVGGESGPNARPMHPAWVRSLRDQCTKAGVPFLFKQWGEWTPDYPDGYSLANRQERWFDNQSFYRMGKKIAGRQLDGREWNEMPEEHR